MGWASVVVSSPFVFAGKESVALGKNILSGGIYGGVVCCGLRVFQRW